MDTNDIVLSGMQLKKLIEKKAAPLIEEFQLRPVELDLLVFLAKEDSVDTASEIMKRKHLSKAHISKSLEHLHHRGYIQFQEDPEDRRMLHIILTEQSYQVIEKVVHIYMECRRILQEGLTPQERAVMKRAIKKMNDNINKELGEL